MTPGYPYLMQSERFATPAADQVLVPEERMFRNTTPYWLRVHSIGMGLVGLPAAGAAIEADEVVTYTPSNSTAYRPEWAVRFGSTEITNGWAPIGATAWDPHGGEFVEAMTVFDQAVYLAPNDRLDFKLRFRAAPAANKRPYLFARCSAVARPDAIRVPVLYGWESSIIDPPAAAISEEVPLGRFYNEFDETIHVDRMIGRMGLDNFLFPHHHAADLLVDMEMHDGTKITRAPTPISILFEPSRQSWPMNFGLPSKGYIKTALSGSIAAAGDPIRVYLGMLGYRTIG